MLVCYSKNFNDMISFMSLDATTLNHDFILKRKMLRVLLIGSPGVLPVLHKT